MRENKNLPVHQDFSVDNPALHVMAETLGASVVEADLTAATHTAEVDLFERQLKVSDTLRGKIQPEAGSIRYQLGRIAGKSIRPDEKQWLKDNPAEESARRRRSSIGTKSMAELNKSIGLSTVRDTLLSITKDKDKKLSLDSYLEFSASPFLILQRDTNLSIRQKKNQVAGDDAKKPKTEPDFSWSNWLGAEASDDQLTNFLQWHVHSLAEQSTSAEFEALVKEEREAYKAAVRAGIDDGWLSEDAEAAILDVDIVKVQIGDMFDTLIAGRGGYHRTDTDYVVIAQGTGEDTASRMDCLRQNIRHALMHEWNHAVLGELGDEWINEALTEHIARSFKYGRPEIVNPDIRRQNEPGFGAYVARRQLLDAMLSLGAVKVDVRAATKLYSSDAGELKEHIVENFLNDELEKSWGVTGVISEISYHVYLLEKKYMEAGMDKMDAQEAAAHEARSDLLQQPAVVFFDGYERPDSPTYYRV